MDHFDIPVVKVLLETRKEEGTGTGTEREFVSLPGHSRSTSLKED